LTRELGKISVLVLISRILKTWLDDDLYLVNYRGEAANAAYYRTVVKLFDITELAGVLGIHQAPAESGCLSAARFTTSAIFHFPPFFCRLPKSSRVLMMLMPLMRCS
jgi:hypothetical protein